MEASNCLIASNLVQRSDKVCFSEPVNWQIKSGEQWAIIGPNGAGKTLFIDTLAGKYALKAGKITCLNASGKEVKPSEYIKIVAFRDIYSLSDTRESFYQQRWNVGVMQDGTPTRELLPKTAGSEWGKHLIARFGIEDLLEKDIRLLSSGELRKFLVVKSLLNSPQILILDNPYIGLDAVSRKVLNELFEEIIAEGAVQIVLVLSNPADIPAAVTHVLPIVNRSIKPAMSKNDFLNDRALQKELFAEIDVEKLHFPATPKEDLHSSEIIRLSNIHIQYGQRTILHELNWKIEKGEKWALLGPNGSGKSTLLSLISGDNPQAYANDIHLFGKKRGSGESIWEIKKRIGYISPEMHLHYLKNIPCLDIVGSGFFDTIGLYLSCSEEQKQKALEWMQLFGISHLKDVSFLQASSGEQRLTLLTRVFVKNPDLLILDEPLHGLDARNKEKVKNIIEKFCGTEKSLIFVTHYDEDIPKIVDKRFVLSKR
ncbi:MAG: putative molybdenum transport ATP-binding protein [Bacteroidetes bacterium]|nr:putative molybdenum transport ATP-binding protein [Bacteroidota bacterium]